MIQDSEFDKTTPTSETRERLRAKWRRRLRRRVRVYFALLLLCLCALVGFVPLPVTKRARQFLAPEARKQLGVDVSIGRAWVYVAGGEVELSDVVLSDPLSRRELYRIGRVVVSGDARALFGRWGAWPERVILEDPAPVAIQLSSMGGVSLTAPLGELVRLVEAARARVANASPKSAPAAAESKQARDPDLIGPPATPRETPPAPRIPLISLLRARISLQDEARQREVTAISLDQVTFIPNENVPGDFSIAFDGLLESRVQSPVFGRLTRRSREKRLALEARINSLEGVERIPWNGTRLWWRTRDLHFDVQATGDLREGMSVQFNARSPLIELAGGRGATRPYFASPLRLAVTADVAPGGPGASGSGAGDPIRLNLHSLRLNGPDLDVTCSGAADLARTGDYLLAVSVNRFPTEVFRQMAEQLAAYQVTYDMPSTSTLKVEAQARGRFDAPASTTLSGRFSLGGLQVRHPALAAPLDLERIQGLLTPGGAEISLGRWQAGQMGGTASARLEGLLFRKRCGRLNTEFTLEGNANDLLILARKQGIIPAVVEGFDANLRGRGALSLDLALSEGAVRASEPDWEVSLSWDNGTLNLTNLQDALRLETGAIEINPQSLELTRLRAVLGGITTRWNGTLTGSPVFWKKSRLRLEGQGETSLPVLNRCLRWSGVDAPILNEVNGNIAFRVALEGPPARPERLAWRGTLHADGVQFETPLRGASGTVHDLEFDAAVTSSTLSISNMHGYLEDIRVDGRIDLDERRIEAETRIAGPIRTAISLFRRDLGEFRGEGIVPAQATARLTAREPLPNPGAPVVLRWVQALQRPGAIDTKPDSPIQFELNGMILPQGGSFWHEEMPVKVTNIRGRILVDAAGLTIQQAYSQWGDVQDVLVRGRVTLYPQPAKVTFELDAPRLNIKNYDRGWSQPEDGMHGGSIYRDPNLNGVERHYATIEGTVRAREVQYFGLKGKNLFGRLRFESWRAHPNTLDLTDLSVSCYDGAASGSLRFVFERGALPQCSTAVQAMNINIQTFLSDLLQRDEKTVGRLDGIMRLKTNFIENSSYRGAGTAILHNTRLIGGPIFPRLGKLLRSTVLEDTTFTTARIGFRILDETVWLDEIKFDSPGVQLAGQGNVGFNLNLDGTLHIGMTTPMLDKVPILGRIPDPISLVARQLVRFKVSGPLGDPKVDTIPVPATLDLWNRLFGGEPKQ